MIPFGLGPNVGVLVPSGRTVSFETSVQVPTRSLAVCAAARPEKAIPQPRNAVMLRANAVRGFIVLSLDCRSDREQAPGAVHGRVARVPINTRRMRPGVYCPADSIALSNDRNGDFGPSPVCQDHRWWRSFRKKARNVSVAPSIVSISSIFSKGGRSDASWLPTR